jgi:hypothetical protein
MQQPQQLNIECTIGALKLTKQGSLSSLVARYRMPENNQASTFSANYEARANSNYSKNFRTISKSSGGILPRLNLSIGAPAATFIEQSITTDKAHGVYNLLKAATKSNFGTQDSYTCISDTTNPESGTGQAPPSGVSSSSYFDQGNSGYIPLKKNEVSGEEAERLTWNIWKQLVNNELAKKSIPALGVTNYESLGVPHVETAVGPQIPGITVNAANSIAILERIFPLSDDLAYKAPNIYFARPGGGTPIKKTVAAKGGINCGFWLRFKNLTDFAFYKSNNSVNKSSIRIAFGNFKKQPSDKISQFAIIISENSTVLRYLNPVTQNFESINLNNKAFINSGILDIFIHFAGPNMFVGFDKEISNWNIFEPQTFGTDETKFYEPYIDEQSKIQVLVENFNCTYTYSPICFDAFDPDAIFTSSASGYSNPDGNSAMNIRFDVNSDDLLAINSCSESELNNKLIRKKNPFPQQTESESILNKPKEGPTYYSDWRRVNRGTNNQLKSFDEYKDEPELKYFEIDKTESTAKDKDPRTYFKGRIRYETTIEGPLFFYARNFKDEQILDTPNKMVNQIWGKYADISKYFESASITESFKNKNLSYKESTATINLVNMTNDNIGRQILNALQENILVVTLKCGYDDENKNIFFQGIITRIQVDRASDNFKTTLFCQDLGDYLLDNIRFPTMSLFPLGFRTYKGLMEDIFELGGLFEYYKPRQRIEGAAFDVLHDYYLTRYQGDPIYQLSLNNKLPQVNVENKIKQVVLEILQHLIFTSDKSGYFNAFLPVFRWDPELEQFSFGLRGDTEVEELWLAGESSDEQKLANDPDRLSDDPNANLIHGIVRGGAEGWTETTELDNLHSEIWMVARRFDGEMITEQSNPSFINRAISEESFVKLDNLVTDGENLEQEYIGYVGFNKIFYAKETTENSLVRTKQLARKLFETYEHASRFTYQELKLNVYVTKPLLTHGRFEVKSFRDSGFIDFSGEYNYNSVTYGISANENIIKADITASYFPRVL